MPGDFENLQTLIHQEWSRYGSDVAHRLLTKGMSRAPDLTPAERDQLRSLLDQQLAAHLATPPPAAVPAGPPASQGVKSPSFHPDRVAQIVAEAMHAPTDGSAQRFETLAARARSNLEHELARCDTGWWERVKIRRAMEQCLRAQRDQLVWPPR
ncbi:MAG: hypothetical protein ACO3DQ_09810 [Cephaloticoccus sp.]